MAGWLSKMEKKIEGPFSGLAGKIGILLDQCAAEIKKRPQALPIAFRTLQRRLSLLDQVFQSDDIVLLGFQLAVALSPVEARGSRLLANHLRSEVRARLTGLRWTEAEVLQCVNVADVIDWLTIAAPSEPIDLIGVQDEVLSLLSDRLPEDKVKVGFDEILGILIRDSGTILLEAAEDLATILMTIREQLQDGIRGVREASDPSLLDCHRKLQTLVAADDL